MNEPKNLVEQIEESLAHNHNFRGGSAITLAVAYVIFNRHSSSLVNHFGKYAEMSKAITVEMVMSACQFVIDELSAHVQIGKANGPWAKTILVESVA